MGDNRGQTVVEYIILIGIVVVVLFTLGPLFKRGVQSVLKSTADQLAVQQDADQDFSEGSSHLVISKSKIMTNSLRSVVDRVGETMTEVEDITEMTTNTETNMGFSQ